MAHNIYHEQLFYSSESIPFKAVIKRYIAEPTFIKKSRSAGVPANYHSPCITPSDSDINESLRTEDFDYLKELGYDPPPYFQYHVHDHVQIIQKHTGSIAYLFRGEILNLDDGDILYINPSVPHCWIAKEQTECTSAAFYADRLNYDSSLMRFQPYLQLFSFHLFPFLLIRGDNPYHSMIQNALQNMLEIDQKGGFCYDALLHNQAVLLILLIIQMLVEMKHPSMSSTEDSTLQHALSHFALHFNENISVKDVALHVGMNPDYFSHFFKQRMGISCKKFLNRLRLEKAASLLVSTDLSITEILYESGYRTVSAFYRAFNEAYSMSPTEYRTLHHSVVGGLSEQEMN